MDKSYWESYYKEHEKPSAPSRFAEFIAKEYLEPGMKLVELGCGNGRDSVFFAQHEIFVRGVDQAESEIRFLNSTYAHSFLEFIAADFTRLEADVLPDCIYSRFTLHSISEEDELRVLKWAKDSLAEGGILCVEVRSINDSKLQDGERISLCENIVDGHYRRYLKLAAVEKQLIQLGFEVVYAEESINFAPFGNENPPVIRVVVKK